MHKYVNTRTGAVVETASVCSGEDWEEQKESKPKKPAAKKQQKKEQEMRDNTQVGDEITTIGGIMGRVVTVKEDSLIIETGADRNKMKIARWAIQMNNTANEKLQAEREAAKAAQAKEKEEKAKKKDKKED